MRKTGLVVLALFTSSVTAVAQSGDPVAGEDIYIGTCTECHASAARIARKISGRTVEEKSSWLDTFLDNHHVSDITQKDHLIAFLVSL